jgi:hypothetical protein
VAKPSKHTFSNNLFSRIVRLSCALKYITRDHHVVKFVLSTGFPSFGRGPLVYVRARGFAGDGIFNSDGARAKMVRPTNTMHGSIMNGLLSLNSIVELRAPILVRPAGVLVLPCFAYASLYDKPFLTIRFIHFHASN